MMNSKMDTVAAFCQNVLKLNVSDDRLAHDLTVFADILKEIETLRELDLTDVHPAVVFNPTGISKGDDRA